MILLLVSVVNSGDVVQRGRSAWFADQAPRSWGDGPQRAIKELEFLTIAIFALWLACALAGTELCSDNRDRRPLYVLAGSRWPEGALGTWTVRTRKHVDIAAPHGQ